MRKTKVVIINDGRDTGKHFLITEMPALKAARWADRAFLALAHSGIDIGADYASQGIVGLVAAGINMLAMAKYEELDPLLDELMGCVSIIRDPRNPSTAVPIQFDTDIEDIETVYLIRREVLQLHASFTLAGVQSWLTSASATLAKSRVSLSTLTSPVSSET